MSERTLKTAWMWLENYQVRGMSLDVERQELVWHDTIGCHCSQQEDVRQSVAAFRQKGPPAFVAEVPDAVLDELEQALRAHLV